MMSTAPRTPFNTEIGPHRRFKLVRNSLQDFKDIKRLLDATVNDVVLSVVADGIGRWLRHRHFPTQDLRLRALVPVSTRGTSRGNQAESGNELRAMRGVLPVDEMDPLERLNFMKNAMDHLKDSNQAVAADVITAVENWAPPNLLAQASRLHFATWMFNLVVTNVPGPQIPLYLLGRQALDTFPIPFLARGHALSVAAMSYNGGLNFGLLGDYEALSDIEVLANSIEDSRDDLVATAHQVRDRVKELKADPAARKRVAAARKKQGHSSKPAAKSAAKPTAKGSAAKSGNGKVSAADAIKAAESRAKT
jgi:WS/DGAT/MGAT family acyltransferase